jgi:hypothetical protein
MPDTVKIFSGAVSMALKKFVGCTLLAGVMCAAAGCAQGTGKALTPTLPSTDAQTNADGTKLKASAPTPLTPANLNRVSTLTPELKLQNGASTFEGASLSYEFEIYDNNGGARVAQSGAVAATSASETLWTVPDGVLKLNGSYGWRARAIYQGVAGSWSADMANFRTPLPAPVPDSNHPGPVYCAGSSGKEIADCVAAAYPEKLVATATGDFSLERRWENMEFLRDRLIETGICKGLNLGLNLKRGGPAISRDFIVWRANKGKNGTDRGVDIASGYDDVKTKLKLGFSIHDDPDKSWGHPFYKNYGPVDCTGVN